MRRLTASAVLAVATWWLDVRASRLPFDRGPLIVAVLTGICFGAAMAMALIVSLRACWYYQAVGGRSSALSIDRDGVSLHLLGCDLYCRGRHRRCRGESSAGQGGRRG